MDFISIDILSLMVLCFLMYGIFFIFPGTYIVMFSGMTRHLMKLTKLLQTLMTYATLDLLIHKVPDNLPYFL